MSKIKAFEINHIPNSFFSDIKIINSGYEKTSKKKPARMQDNFNSYSFHYVFSGKGYYKINGKEYTVTKNQIFVIFPNIPITYYPDRRYPWKYSWIDFYGVKSEEFLGMLNVSRENPILENLPLKIGMLFLSNVEDCKKFPNIADLISIYHFYSILIELLKKNIVKEQSLSDNSSSSIISKCMKIIDNSYTNPDFNLQTLSSMVGFNSSYLSRLFKQTLGISFTKYLTQKRLQEAILLIDAGVWSVKNICEAVGFSDQFYFSNVFKKKFGESPKSYIDSVKSRQNHL